ncbi:hypothetical protein ACFSJU_00475 [Paradesertivirga mongoliensis]|uniref:Lipoprotein n=1 Tax=Paradesertivirga mongoliensis TaxID=2100740 RepID=A0ABW4ZG50_9SPHI|nr:hypothetical protein [Pedobacter mongoliensis]
MKKIIIIPLVSLTVCLAFCSKNSIEVSPNNLSACQANSQCSYLFSDQADVDSFHRVQSGAHRLFWFKDERNLGGCQLISTLWIKAPLNKNAFLLDTKDIANGLVSYSQLCICCTLIGVKSIGGYVKGINTNPEKSSDQTKWLIEAEIVLATIHSSKPIDTLYIKQYFYPNFVYN